MPNQNCINLNAESVGGNKVALTYRCEFSPYDYSGVPVNIYLGATAFSPDTSSSAVTCTSPGACSVGDFVNSGNVYILDKGFNVYKYTGKVKEPTWSGVRFPPFPTSGSGILGNVPDDVTVRFGVVLVNSSNGEFIRTDGLPVEMADCVGGMSPSPSGSVRQAVNSD